MCTDSGYGIIAFLCFFCFFTKTDCQFTETPDGDITKCSGNSVNLRWNYMPTNMVTIQWSYQNIEMMSQFQTNAPVYSNNYNNSVLEFVSDAEILLKDLKTSSSGSYSCTITYFSGPIVNSTSLVVYDTFTSGLTCQYKDKAIDCTKPDASVSLNATDEQGKEINIKKPKASGNYTICMYGGAIICRGSFDICTTVEVNIEGAPSNPNKSCGLHPLWCFLGSIFGSPIPIFLYHRCIKRKYWKKVFPVLVVAIVVCLIVSPIVCHLKCLENGWYGVFLAWLISFLATLIVIAIVHNCDKSKGNTNKPNETPTLDTTNKPEQNPTLDTNEKPDQNPTPVPSEKVMLLVKSVDAGIISTFEWIGEKGNLSKDRDKNRLKYSYGSALKVSLVINSLSKEDSGIYQCVRTLPHGVKDKINVVLYVSNACPIYLIVNPFVWEDQSFEDLSPVDLKKIVTKFDRDYIKEDIKTLNSHDGRKADSVDWECSSKTIEEGKVKEINGSTILSAADAGEYRCTVQLNKKTYVFIFYIHCPDCKDSRPETNEHVFGVPSMLNSNRSHKTAVGTTKEKSKIVRKQKKRSQETAVGTTKHTGTSPGIHEEPIGGQVTDFSLPHTIHNETQQHDTP